MGLLGNLEHRLDKLINGSFSRAFKSQVDPVELAAALQQELDLRAENINGRMVVPNVFIFDLSLADYRRLEAYFGNLSSELGTVVSNYVHDQRYDLVASTSISFALDQNFDTGVFRIRSESAQVVREPILTVDPNLTPQVPMSVLSRPATPRLVAVSGQDFPLTRTVTTIGRGEQANIRLNDLGASRVHCEIILGSSIIIRDLNSTNGTFVDGRRIAEVALVDGSLIKVGDTTLTYKSR